MPIQTKLEKEWLYLLNELGVDLTIGETVFSELVTAHTDMSRHYHNLDHVRHLLTLADSVQTIVECPSAIKLAAWFHDYVYDPKAQNNEVQSAIYAEETLTRLNLDRNLTNLVKRIILSTQKHQPLIDGMDNLLFLDLDLSILGAAGDRYVEYAQAIRKEYSWLSDRDYQQGRKQVLTHFLAREKIYYTAYFGQKLEQQARANLTQEIELYS